MINTYPSLIYHSITKKTLLTNEQSLSSLLNQPLDTEPSILPSAHCGRAVTPKLEETADTRLVLDPLLLLFSPDGTISETSRTIISPTSLHLLPGLHVSSSNQVLFLGS